MNSITMLIDNYVKVQGLAAEHGISFLIENNGKKILFDTGQSSLLMENAKKLGVELKDLDSIAISHGHYDHTGGLSALLGYIDKDIKIYAHPDIFKEKYVKLKDIDEKDNYRYIGIPFTEEELEQKKADFVLDSRAITITDDITLIGQIEKDNDPSGIFYTKEDDYYVMDKLLDDNSLFIEANGPSILLLGCAHSGILNILEKVNEEFDLKNGLVVVGGLHLVDHDRKEIIEIAEKIAQYDIKELIPSHCTGIEGYEILKEVFKDRCSMGEVSKNYIIK